LYLVKYDDELQYKAMDLKLGLERNLECVAAENAPSGYYILSNEINIGKTKNITLFKINSTGDVEWTKTFGTSEGNDSGAALGTLKDGRVAVAATMELQTKRKLALIILNSNGNF
jgi:hypothetical protein